MTYDTPISNGNKFTSAEWLAVSIELEHEVLDEILPLIATAPAQKVSQIVSATPAALDDDSNWPAARFAELATRMARVYADEIEIAV